MDDVLELHRALVAIPSVSGTEQAIADFVLDRLSPHNVERVGNTVIASVGEGPVFVLNSHLDTVPPQPGWTDDPWQPRREEGKVIGLGANDAKASVAAMIVAFESLARTPRKLKLVLMLAEGEETRNIGTENGLRHLIASGRNPDAALIGEPTELQSGIAQYGMAVIRLVARGQACHAAHAAALGIRNPIFALAERIAQLEALHVPGAQIQPTMVQGAEARNQVPAEASAILDLRLEPPTQAEEVIAALQGHPTTEIEILSTRLRSYALPDDSERLLQAVPKPHFTSRTMSDQTLFQGIPAIKIGPGATERSHTVDEFVYEHEVEQAVNVYIAIVENYEKTLG